jgi:hypothetical protein
MIIYIFLWSFLYSSLNEYAYPENVVPKYIATTDNAFYFFLVLLTTEIKGEL